MLWMGDNRGALTYANRSWLEFRGRTLDQEIGAAWMEGVHPEDAGFALRQYWSAFSTRAPFRIVYRTLSREGGYQVVERLGTPWFDADGEQRGYVGCITTIRPHGDQTPEAREQLACLSAREVQVLTLVAEGHSTKEVAGKLGISYKTADSHRTHVLKKLRLHETASLVRFAIRAGIISA
jgi:two-component system, NtrC family, sensor kinase